MLTIFTDSLTLINRRGVIQLAALLLVGAPAMAQAQIITVPREKIQDSVESGIECFMHPTNPGCPPIMDSRPDCSLYWASPMGSPDRVQVSRLSPRSVKADVHLKCAINFRDPVTRTDLRDPDVYIRLDLRFSCSLPNPSVRASPTNVDVAVNWPWYVDVGTLSVTWWIGNIASNTASSQARASAALQAFVQQQEVPLSYCPGINVQSNGDLQIDLAMGNECTNGQTRHRGCSANHFGPGYDDVCVGGRWAADRGWCEPRAPRGGEQP
jgi:hypothetical protein